MLEFLDGLAQPLPITIPGEPFAISPYPWRSAYRIPVALIEKQLWIVAPGAATTLGPEIPVGTLDLHECALEPDQLSLAVQYFLLPALRLPGLDDSWAVSLSAEIDDCRGDWLFLRPSEDARHFDRHYGFSKPREVRVWPKEGDFARVIEQAFAGRFLAGGHAERATALLAAVAPRCPPHNPKFRPACPHCGRR